jgi:hypothetical protein
MADVSSLDAPDHSNVHFWYHGTVNLTTPTGDTDATITSTERANWWDGYEQEGANAGFKYSLIGGGNRMSPDEPLGPGYPAIVDGYNQWWDFGRGASANRTALASNNGTWPNLIQFNVLGTNIVTAGQTISTKFYYQYGGESNSVTAQFFYDRDLDPYNTNTTLITLINLPNTGVNDVYYDTLELTTTNVPPGVYAIYGKMWDGTHTRYLYTAQVVQILAVPVLGITRLNATQFRIVINGVAGQTVILQSSPNLKIWTPLVTNTLTSSSWTYTNSVPLNSTAQFYEGALP